MGRKPVNLNRTLQLFKVSLGCCNATASLPNVLDHTTSQIVGGSNLGIDATKKSPGEGFKRLWPPLVTMDAEVKAKVEKLFKP